MLKELVFAGVYTDRCYNEFVQEWFGTDNVIGLENKDSQHSRHSQQEEHSRQSWTKVIRFTCRIMLRLYMSFNVIK